MKNLKKIILLPVIISLALGFGIFANAQEAVTANNAAEQVPTSDLGVSEPTILPDSPFYFIKNWVRGLNLALTFDEVKKAELESKFTNEKLIELRKIIANGVNSEKIQKATENYQKSVDRVKNAADKIKDKAENNAQVNNFLEKFTKQQVLQEKILQKLESQVSEKALEKIKNARETHLEKFQEVMTKLESNNDRTVERIENALINSGEGGQSQEGSSGILDRIKEKMPKPIQQRIEGIKENVREKVNDKLIKKATEKNQEKNCPQVMPVVDFCRNGIVKVERDQKGCATSFNCLIPSEQKVCAEVYIPVCGKNGKTYGNECFAKLAKIEINYKGECKDRLQKECKSDGECPQIMRPCIAKSDGAFDCPPKIKCVEGKCIAVLEK